MKDVQESMEFRSEFFEDLYKQCEKDHKESQGDIAKNVSAICNDILDLLSVSEASVPTICTALLMLQVKFWKKLRMEKSVIIGAVKEGLED